MRDSTLINEFVQINKKMQHLSTEVSRVLVDHNVLMTALKKLLIEKNIITDTEVNDTMTNVINDIKKQIETAAVNAKNKIEQPVIEKSEHLKTEN